MLLPKFKNSITKKYSSKFKKKKRYKIISEIGKGGIATVTSFLDTYLNRITAIKKLQSENRENEHLVKAFITESRLISFLDHPGIIPIYDIFVDEDENLSYTMKRIEGKTLTDILDDHRGYGAKNTPMLLDIFIRISQTLAYAHSRGVIHLDVKPDNIMVGKFGEVTIMDWGNAKIYDSKPYSEYFKDNGVSPDSIETLSESVNIIMGTPDYMSPEQSVMSRTELTPASDIFSIGIILYQILTGIQPFGSYDKTKEVLKMIRTANPKEPREINSDIPIKLSTICTKMLKKNTKDRYSNLKQVLDDIRDFYDSGQTFKSRIYNTGEIIFREGDIGTYAFKIIEGKVEISKQINGEKNVLNILGKGEIVGEIAIFSNQPRTATVTTIETTEIKIMGRESVELELEKLSPWVGGMIKTLSERFIFLNDKVAGKK